MNAVPQQLHVLKAQIPYVYICDAIVECLITILLPC